MENNTTNDIDPSAEEFDNGEEIQYDSETDDAPVTIQKLKERLKICMAERSEYLDGWQRAKADLINARKTFDAERIKVQDYAFESAILEIIPVIDSFEMAFSNKTAWETVAPNWRIGVEYIYNQLLKILENHTVAQINPLNELFDPISHTAIETVATDNKEKDQYIVEVVAKGYRMHEKIIRPAQVKTAHYETSSSV